MPLGSGIDGFCVAFLENQSIRLMKGTLRFYVAYPRLPNRARRVFKIGEIDKMREDGGSK